MLTVDLYILLFFIIDVIRKIFITETYLVHRIFKKYTLTIIFVVITNINLFITLKSRNRELQKIRKK